VYALLGLTYDSGLFLPVSNDKQSVEAICLGMTLTAISTISPLDIVAILGGGPDNQFNLPSWVPNWFYFDESNVARPIPRLLGQSKYENRKVTKQLSFSKERDVLRVNAQLARLMGFVQAFKKPETPLR